MSVSIEVFLKQRSVRVVVGGSYILPHWYDQHGKLRKFACRTSRVSPFRMLVDAPVIGKTGDTVTSYFAEFGKLKGVIADAIGGSFLVDLTMPPERRAQMSDQLGWLEAHQNDPSVKDSRTHARIVPAVPHSTVTMADGSVHGCFIINLSISGAAVSSSVQPSVGTPLAVGACVGRVVRTLPDGFAVQFVEEQRRSEMERLIAPPVALAKIVRTAMRVDVDRDACLVGG